MTLRHPNIPAMHPGELLREDVLPALPFGKAELARRLGISRQRLYDILGEKTAVSPEIAARIGKLCGNGPSLWLRLQADYDAWRIDRLVDVSDIETVVIETD